MKRTASPSPLSTNKKARMDEKFYIITKEALTSLAKKFQDDIRAAQEEFLALPSYGLHLFDDVIVTLPVSRELRRECVGCDDLRYRMPDLFRALCLSVREKEGKE